MSDAVAETPQLTVRVLKPGTAYRIELSVGDEEQPSCILPVDEKTMHKARTDLDSDLEAIKRTVGSTLDLTSWNAVRAAMSKLHAKSEDLAWRLLGKNPDRLESLDDSLHRALQLSADGRQYPLVEVRTESGSTFPFELLMHRSIEPDDIRDKTDLLEACDAFLGFSAVLRRTIVPGDLDEPPLLDQDNFLRNDDGLNVKHFYYARLPGAQAEREFFAHHRRVLVPDGPWPEEPTAPAVASAQCANVIFDPRITFSGKKRKVPDQIQHFSCHCDTYGTDSDNYRLRLAAGENDHVDIRLRDLNEALKALTFKRRKKRNWLLPLVFLNACGSSKIDYAAAASLPEFFLAQQNRAFIGTETNMPDLVAAQLSEYFYLELISGASVGEALNQAKRQLVLLHGNPLGLLYTLYGNPDLRVNNPIPREAVI